MGYKIKRKKESSTRSLGNMEEKKGGKNEVGKQRIDGKEARHVAR